jgi:Ni/Fe-hydrogenase subunit HybB-like protein
MGGAGFTLAMLVYIFQLQRFKPVVRGAVLLGLMCYTSVAIGLSMDIGIWWRIVFPVFHWQVHSVLFEIAWCIMLYLLVLVVEFSHAVVQRFGWQRVLGMLEKTTIVFVILGISLSTLHQSSLGTLFLATPFRLHPLWHTDFLPLLFFVSSMALGCLTISFLTIVVYWLYGGDAPMRAISGLGKIAMYLLIGYVAVKLIEILAAGEGSLLLAGNWDTANFWFELLLSAVIPIIVLSQNRYRNSKTAMFWVSLCAIIGMSLNRVNVAGLATLSLTQAVYFPTWTEWAMTLGILSAAALVYLFGVEYFSLFPGLGRERVQDWITPVQFDHADWKTLYFGGQRLGSFQLYSLVFVLAAAISFGLSSNNAVFGVSPERTPTANPHRVEVIKTTAGDNVTAAASGGSATFAVAAKTGNPHPEEGHSIVMLLDGNRNGRYVLFDHDAHVGRYEGDASCVLCHHMNKPYDRTTGCYQCHSDMYLAVDVFDHDLHMTKMGGNPHCSECHTNGNLLKVRENTKDCLECHKAMVATGSRVQLSGAGTNTLASGPDGSTFNSIAVGYIDAMHGLCINCHKEVQETLSPPNENFSRCTHCHQALPDLNDDEWKQHL